MLNVAYPESYTQAYQAGVICAMAHNIYTKEELPNFIECAVNFYALRELFGERLWQKMRVRSNFRERIALYENMCYQPNKPKALMGTPIDFALGYVKSYERSKRKIKLDKERLLVIENLTLP